MRTDSPSTEPLLTAGDIRKRADEYRDLEKEVADRVARMSRIREWLETAGKLIGTERLEAIAGPLGEIGEGSKFAAAKERQTFTSFIENYVIEQGRGVDYKELREVAWNSPMRSTMERTDKTFHSAIGKLVEANRIIRHNQRLFTHAAYRDYMQRVERGEIVDTPPEGASNRQSPMADVISRYVSDCAGGRKSREIVAYVGGIAEFADVVQRNSTSVYNQLSRMVRQGKLRKEGTRYFSPEGGNENGEADASPETADSDPRPIESDTNKGISR